MGGIWIWLLDSSLASRVLIMIRHWLWYLDVFCCISVIFGFLSIMDKFWKTKMNLYFCYIEYKFYRIFSKNIWKPLLAKLFMLLFYSFWPSFIIASFVLLKLLQISPSPYTKQSSPIQFCSKSVTMQLLLSIPMHQEPLPLFSTVITAQFTLTTQQSQSRI